MSFSNSGDVAARGVAELYIQQLWREILGVQSVARGDDFFVLGGDSVTALQMVARIERELGVEVVLDALLPDVTVVRLADAVTAMAGEAQHATGGPLVAIQPRGSNPPLFLVHPAGGSVLCYLELAHRLGFDQPVYGLRGPSLGSAHPLPDRVETLASDYLRSIRAFQPRGPYRIGGFSFGGFVAFEMARQLVAEGARPPRLVALLDTAAPAAVSGRPEDGLPAELAAALEGHSLDDEVDDLGREKQLWDGLAELAEKYVTDLTPPPVGSRRSRRPSRMGMIQRFFLTYRFFPVGEELEYRQVRRFLRCMRVNLSSASRYAPNAYAGDITVFQARERLSAAEVPVSERLAGWSDLVRGELRVRQVPGHHLNLLSSPSVDVVAEGLREELARGLDT